MRADAGESEYGLKIFAYLADSDLIVIIRFVSPLSTPGWVRNGPKLNPCLVGSSWYRGPV